MKKHPPLFVYDVYESNGGVFCLGTKVHSLIFYDSAQLTHNQVFIKVNLQKQSSVPVNTIIHSERIVSLNSLRKLETFLVL